MKRLLFLLALASARADTSANATVGQTAVLTVTVSGSDPIFYAWQKNGQLISNANQSTLTISPVAFSDAGSYTASATNSAGTANSDAATLTVSPMLANLSANVTSVNYPAPAIYTWRLNGQTIPGANQPTYQFDPALQPGSYSLLTTWPNIPAAAAAGTPKP